jgi:4,5-DOPA dioxygenase extradiol
MVPSVRLAPLRDRGVLIVGSGNIVHNLRALSWEEPDAGFDWARRFDEAARAALTETPSKVPALRTHDDFIHSAPTPDHFIPLLYIAGLAGAAGRPPQSLVDGYAYGSLSMAAYTLDAKCPIEAGDTRPAATSRIPPWCRQKTRTSEAATTLGRPRVPPPTEMQTAPRLRP